MNTLAEILQQDESTLITVKGHSTKEANYLDNWKTSSRKPLSVIYTLVAYGIANNRLQGEYYGETSLAAIGSTTEANRTEIIIHYPNKHLLKLIPIK